MLCHITEIKLEESFCCHILDRSEYRVVCKIRNERCTLIPTAKLSNDAENPCCNDTDKDWAFNSVVPECSNNEDTDKCKNHRSRTNITELNESWWLNSLAVIVSVCCDNACALKTYNCDKKTDTCRNTVLEVLRNLVYKCFTEFEDWEDNENNTLNKDSCQSYLPWICDTLLCKLRNNCVCKICIQSHTGSKNYRIVGIKCHDECCESSRYSCCCKDCIRIHSCGRKNTRVYSEYVSHCKECCNAGNNLGFDISAVFFQFENLFQKKAPLKYFVETRHS